MRRVFDRGAAVVAAPVPRDFLGARYDPHGGGAGQQRQRPADMGVGNRVARLRLCGGTGRLARFFCAVSSPPQPLERDERSSCRDP